MKKQEKEKPSMAFFVVFEHLMGGLVRKGNLVIKIPGVTEITEAGHIAAIETHLKEKMSKVDPVVIDFKPLKIEETK